jgi:hypothetical protein
MSYKIEAKEVGKIMAQLTDVTIFLECYLILTKNDIPDHTKNESLRILEKAVEIRTKLNSLECIL